MVFRNNLIVLSILSSLAFVSCKKDDKVKDVFSKDNIAITGAQEVPAKTTEASGSMNVSYSKTTKLLSLSASWSNLSGDPVDAHIHGIGAAGVNAGVKFDLGDQVTTSTGSFTAEIPVDNIAIIEDSLIAGFYYFNIHTPTNPAGEIRGQIVF